MARRGGAVAAGGGDDEEAEVKEAVVSHVDMPTDMLASCIKFARSALKERSIEKDVATLVKKTLDENLGGTWHVVVGESFGCSVTHETKYIAFFQLGLVYFLVFRSLDDEPIPED